MFDDISSLALPFGGTTNGWWTAQRPILRKTKIWKKAVYLTGKRAPSDVHEVADKLVKAIRDSGNEKLTLHYQPILDEDHATILHIAVYRAFKKLNEKEGE
ncbi:MAG: hypothetical protein R2825_16750 [Saprospiraceae bacterium]